MRRGGGVRIDLLVHGGDVLTVDDAGTVVRDVAVAVHEGEIVAVGPADGPGRRFRARRTRRTYGTPSSTGGC
ncbi:hypothetical protein ACWCPI_21060 [Streptomyces sp. NPDC001920]